MDDVDNENYNEEGFHLPERPTENYSSILHVRNAEQLRMDKEHPPEEPPPLYSFCGENCRQCEYFIGENVRREEDKAPGCRGCRAEGGDCDIRICCLSKSIDSCGKCEEFPCDLLKKSSVEDDNDEENLLRMKEERDRESDSAERVRYAYAFSLSAGFILGLATGAVSGFLWQFLICGIIVGTAVPIIIFSDKRK